MFSLASKSASSSKALPSVTYVTSLTSTTTSGTQTFTSANIGTAYAERYVIVAVNLPFISGSGTSISVTLGGTAMTLLVEINVSPTNNSTYVGLFGLKVPTGTTATIVISGSSISMTHAGIGIWNANDITSLTPVDTATVTATSSGAKSLNCDVVTGDLIIATVAERNGSTISNTWAGVTENYDTYIGTASGGISGASALATTTATPRTITVTPSATPTRLAACAIVLR